MNKEMWLDTKEELFKYLQTELGFTEDTAEDALDELEEYEEESWKRQTRVSGYIHNPDTNLYYFVSYLYDYDWGASDFNLDTTPYKQHKETKVVGDSC